MRANRVYRLGKADQVIAIRIEIEHPDLAKPRRTLVHHQVVPKCFGPIHFDVGVVGKYRRPVGLGRSLDRCRDQAKVGCPIVRGDVEAIAAMADAVLDSLPHGAEPGGRGPAADRR